MAPPSPPAGARRARRRTRRVDAILDAAMAIVAAEGLDGLTVHRVAEALDCAVGGLYRYFPSKAALIGALEHRVVAAFGDDLSAALADADRRLGDAAAPGDPAALLAPVLVAARTFERLAVEDPGRFRLVDHLLAVPEQVVPDEDARRVAGELVRVLGLVAERLALAARAGALAPGDPAERTLLLWSGLRGVLQTRKLARFAPGLVRPRALLDALARDLLAGWGAPRPPLDRALALAALPAPEAPP